VPQKSMLVFVSGTGRCGSTLITEVLTRHPDVGFISNVDDRLNLLNLSGRWNNALFRHTSSRHPRLVPFKGRRRLLELGRIRFAPSEGWEVLERQVSRMFTDTHRDLVADDLNPWLEQRIRQFFERRMAVQQKSRFVHHVTGWPRSGLFQAVFPAARFINVVRDGRAVANSWLQMPWWSGYLGPGNWDFGPLPECYAAEWKQSGESFVVLAAVAWKLLIDATERARAAIPPGQWLDVRFEDVLANPRPQFEAMLKLAGLEWTPQFEAGFRRYSFVAGRSYRRDLSPASLAHLEQALVGHLRHYGYELSNCDEAGPGGIGHVERQRRR
jgi:Sulfotransferase family